MDCAASASCLRDLLVSHGNADKQVSLMGKLTVLIFWDFLHYIKAKKCIPVKK